MLPLLIFERNIEPIVVTKSNQFVSFKFGDVQLLDILNFLGGTKSLDSFLKACKTSDTQSYFPYEWFSDPEKPNKIQLAPYETFFSKLRNINLSKKTIQTFKVEKMGLTSKEGLSKLKMNQPPATGQENYQQLTNVWQEENMCSFKDILRWYNNKDVLPTLEAMQKMVYFYHNRGIDLFKLGYILPNLANFCLHKSTTAKLYPFRECDKDLLGEIREIMVGGPSVVFTR